MVAFCRVRRKGALNHIHTIDDDFTIIKLLQKHHLVEGNSTIEHYIVL